MKNKKNLFLSLFLLSLGWGLSAQSFGCLTHVSHQVVSAIEVSPGECLSQVELCLRKNQPSMVEMDFQINYSLGAQGRKYDVSSFAVGHQICHIFEFTGPCDNNISLTGYGRNNNGTFCGAWSNYFPLPVELVSFEGRNRNGENCLEWTVTNEEDIARYIIERSEDGKLFIPVAQVPAMADGMDVYTYDHCDPIKASQVFLYRMAIYEQSGEISYSPVISIQRSRGAADAPNVWPIPSRDMVFFENMQGSLNVWNAQGAAVQLISVGSGAYNIQHLAPGTYFVQDERAQTLRFIKE